MAIKALVKIFDDKNGKTYVDNYLLEPTCTPFSSHIMEVTRYDFQFHFNIIDEGRLPKPTVLKGDYNCMACAHDWDSNMCSECENGSKFLKWR